MAKSFSAEEAIGIILEARDACVEGVSSTLEDKEYSEDDDHVSVK